MEPIVSVVMSVYNEKIDWLKESIESILVQTFRAFEFIIICDNPHYNEGICLLKCYADKDSRIRLIFNEYNIGLTKSLNKGIKEARGKYIARMDADDYAFPERFEKQISFMESNPNIVASGTAAYMWRENECKRFHRKSNPKQLRSRIAFESPIYHPSAIFKRVIDGNLIQYNENFKYSQDYALWISLMKSYELSNIDEPLIKYRISRQQISTSKHEEQREYALKNQRNAIELYNLDISEVDLELILDLTRRTEMHHNENEIYDFIVRFMMKIKNRSDIDYGVVAEQWLLVYVNRIARSNNLFKCIGNYLKLCSTVGYFSFYSLLSLVSKYIKK